MIATMAKALSLLLAVIVIAGFVYLTLVDVPVEEKTVTQEVPKSVYNSENGE